VRSKRDDLEQQGVPSEILEKLVEEFREAEMKAAKGAKAAAAKAKAMKAAAQESPDARSEGAGGSAEAEHVAGADVSAEAADSELSGMAAAEAEHDAGAEVPAEAAAKAEPDADPELSGKAAKAEHVAGLEVSAEAVTKADHVAEARGPKPTAKKPKFPQAVVIDGPNKEYLSEVQDDISTILQCKVFKGIAQEDPLPISKDSECGIQEPFKSEQCETALRKRGTYISGFNFFWLDLLRSPTPGIPLSRERVRALADYMFHDGPAALKKPIGVAVSSADFPVQAHKGSLLMITPEEKAHAILLKVADDVRRGAKRSKDWKLVLLSVPVYIEVIAKEEQVQWEAFNARQLVFQEHWTMTRTAQQQCYEVVAVKVSLQRELGRLPTKKEISDKFRVNGKMTDGKQDDYSENFVKDSLIIYEKILSSPVLLQIIVIQEKRDGQNALWNHMGKLSVLASKAVDQDERKWVMDALEDLQTNGHYMAGDLSKSILQGDKAHVGIIALLIFKFKVLRRWSGFTFTAIGLRPEDVTELQERTKGHKEYFASAGPNADQSWLGKLKPSAVAAFRLLEAESLATKSCFQLHLSWLHTSSIHLLCVAGSRVQEVPRSCLEGDVQAEQWGRCSIGARAGAERVAGREAGVGAGGC
jgi:hypothetical protein